MVEGRARLKGWKDPPHPFISPPPRPTPANRTKHLALATLAMSSLRQFRLDLEDHRQLLEKRQPQLERLRAAEIQAGGEGWPCLGYSTLNSCGYCSTVALRWLQYLEAATVAFNSQPVPACLSSLMLILSPKCFLFDSFFFKFHQDFSSCRPVVPFLL